MEQRGLCKRQTLWYDAWNPIHERITGSTESVPVQQRNYLWGLDLSETMQGAGGVGGLLMVQVIKDAIDYAHLVTVACYDANGNIMAYVDNDDDLAATFEYAAFGEGVGAASESVGLQSRLGGGG